MPVAQPPAKPAPLPPAPPQNTPQPESANAMVTPASAARSHGFRVRLPELMRSAADCGPMRAWRTMEV